jgi:hypothetical protein
MNSKILIWLVVGVFVGWRIYMRLKRNIGEQQFRPKRLKFYIVVFSLATVGCAILSVGHQPVLLGWLGGTVLGVLLGWWSLRLTTFATIAAGRFYTPNAHIGIGLSLLFIGRLLYRVFAVYSNLSFAGRPAPALGQSALTFFTFELLAGYYVAYSLGVLGHYAKEDRPPDPVA